LDGARDAIRRLRLTQDDDDRQTMHVTVHAGTYSAPFTLTGSDDSDAVWEGEPGAVISAATAIPSYAFTRWGKRAGVWKANLTALGFNISGFGNLSTADSGTGNLGCLHNRAALYFNMEPMVLARFPNIDPANSAGWVGRSGWNYSLIDKGGVGWFDISTEDPAAGRLLKWATAEPNPWLHGYWYFSWEDGYVPLVNATALVPGMIHASIGSEDTTVKAGARFYGTLLLNSSLQLALPLWLIMLLGLQPDMHVIQ
jgi:hypothetical protein